MQFELIVPNGKSIRTKFNPYYHNLIIFSSAGIIFFFYYAYSFSIPTYPDHWLNWFWSIFHFEISFHLLGILLNIPIIYSNIVLNLKKSLTITVIFLICITPYLLLFSFRIDSLLICYAILLIPAMLIITIKLELLSRAKERKIWAEREQMRIMIARQQLKAQEGERKHLAEELHDGVIQTSLFIASTAKNILLSNAGELSDSLEIELTGIERHSLNIAKDLRRICRDLMPSVLENLGFNSAIRWLADCLHEETGINASIVITGAAIELSQTEKITLFRLVQETINNIRRHSGASIVNIYINYSNSDISIVITDNGRGFNVPENFNDLVHDGKLGMIGMYERAKLIGAKLTINSAIGAGTTVSILLERSNQND